MIKRVGPEKELSDMDYFLYYFMHAAATALRTRELNSFARIIPDAIMETNMVRRWKSKSDGDEIFEISKIVHRVGLIKYVGLDSEKRVIELNKKYKNRKAGVALLMKLLKERYEQRGIR